MRILFGVLALIAAAGLFSAPVFAIGSDTTKPQVNIDRQYQDGKRAIQAAKYDRGISLMKEVVKARPRNADAHNYLGFAYRKQGKLKLAAASYKVALWVNAKHKGALEYQGELFLKLRDLASARKNLATLRGLCPSGCKELAELRRAIADYTAANGST